MELILVIGGPSLKQIKTKYRRFEIYEFLKNNTNKRVLWCSGSNKNKQIQFFDDEIIFPQSDYFKGFEPINIFNIKKELDSFCQKYTKVNVIYTLHRLSYIIDLIPKSNFFYDASDNWVHGNLFSLILQRFCEKKIIKNSNKISCSSLYIYNRIKNKNTSKFSVIKSGGTLREQINKERNHTVIIGDLDNKKYDLSNLINIKTKIYHYGKSLLTGNDLIIYEKLKNSGILFSMNYLSQDELFIELCKYKTAILPYGNNEFCSGIYPVKIYELINSGVLILFYGSIELKENLELGIVKYSSFQQHDYNFINNKVVLEKRKQFLSENTWDMVLEKLKNHYGL